MVSILYGRGWTAVYNELGILVYQDDTIDAAVLLRGLGFSVEEGDFDDGDLQAYLDANGPFPSDIKTLFDWIKEHRQ